MRISDRYIGRQILSGTLFAILLLSVLLVLGNVFQKIRPLLVEINAPLSALGDFVLSVLPVSLSFTIPWGFLSAILLVFGRMSSDNELNSFRTAGISLVRLSMPVIVIGALLSAFCLWLNLKIAPEAKKQVDNIITRTILRDPRVLLRAGIGQNHIKNVRIDSEADDGEVFRNFHIFKMDDARSKDGGAYIHADTATSYIDHEKQQIKLRLTGVYSDGRTKDGDKRSIVADELEWMYFDYSDNAVRPKKMSAMNNREIDEYLVSETFLQWPEEIRDRDEPRYLAEKVRRYSSALACLAFAVIGVPLGIKARRRDTSSGLVISLLIGAGYFMAGNLISDSGADARLLWLPNLVCAALGIILFRRARFR